MGCLLDIDRNKELMRLGKCDGMKLMRECNEHYTFDLETRLRSSQCGSRRVVVMFEVPRVPNARAAE